MNKEQMEEQEMLRVQREQQERIENYIYSIGMRRKDRFFLSAPHSWSSFPSMRSS